MVFFNMNLTINVNVKKSCADSLVYEKILTINIEKVLHLHNINNLIKKKKK